MPRLFLYCARIVSCCSLVLGLLAVLGLNPLSEPRIAQAATYTVTNMNDSGPGSLRQAMTDAITNPGADTITFDIPGTGPYTITLASSLPTIIETVTIDGWSQPGFSGVPLIEINGSAVTYGIVITSSNSLLRGLIVNGFVSTGIRMDGSGATGNQIAGCYIGTNATGTAAKGNGDGISIQNGARDNIIGTDGNGADDEAEGNVISGNRYYGIAISGVSAYGNIVAGNLVGLNVSGSSAITNGGTS